MLGLAAFAQRVGGRMLAKEQVVGGGLRGRLTRPSERPDARYALVFHFSFFFSNRHPGILALHLPRAALL